MSRKSNQLLAELKRTGLTDGVVITVTDGGVSVQAGKHEIQWVDADPELALEEALAQLLDEILALPADQRPKAWEATTRTTADHLPDTDFRMVRPLSEDDFS